ncbi:patatin-like phospholipase family protein [Mesorhizobium australicum]|uniref:Patatin-like phospholipase family protein n=1 Tax=Mesorhizobium australicum TaxID=536018 RepID=A0ACC6T7D4_9HYPH
MPNSARLSLIDVLTAEAEVISRRRALVASGQLAGDRGHGLSHDMVASKYASHGAPIKVKASHTLDERGIPCPRLDSEKHIVGLALSGGGVRSAAFCLGVVQALDSINEDNEPKVLDLIDYLSTVSGGGYIGASLAAGLMQTEKGRFPFASKLDQQETLETQHIRDYSNYLAPAGSIDILVGAVAVVRGLLINAMIFIGIILTVAVLTIAINPTESALRQPLLDFTGGKFPSVFLWSAVFSVVFIIIQIGYSIIGLRPSDRTSPRTTLIQREMAGRLFASALVLCVLVSLFSLQAFVLAGLFDAANLANDPNYQANWIGKAWHRLGTYYPMPWTFLVVAATAFAAFGNKLSAVATASRGDRTWKGLSKHWMSRVAIYCGASVIPLLFWFTYIALSYWGIRSQGRVGVFASDVPLLAWLSSHSGSLGAVGLAYASTAAVLLGLSILVTPNANSLHGYYRDRLSRAFLWKLDDLKAAARDPSEVNNVETGAHGVSRAQVSDNVAVDQFKLSSLKPHGPEGWSDAVRFAPYLLVNATVNLEGSKYLNRRGRNADSFVFSPLYVGSQATGYSQTVDMESADHNMNLGTAMAISGAAASANMGASTIRILTFSLAALNVRLGYWLPNPRLLKERLGLSRWLANIGPWYFAKETFGLLNELTKNIYLTDGGHFDDLGLYELLKRRCKVIIVADGEADPPLNFPSLIRVQQYARIDLGVLIDLPWEEIRHSGSVIAQQESSGELNDRRQYYGPHVAVGRIDYGENEHGVLLYIKSSISGDESDLIRDYRRRKPNFPQETTLDQFFSEEQFEVYRALGFHATRNFFTGRDRSAMLKTCPANDWPEVVQQALQRLNIPAEAVTQIMQRQQDAMVL